VPIVTLLVYALGDWPKRTQPKTVGLVTSRDGDNTTTGCNDHHLPVQTCRDVGRRSERLEVCDYDREFHDHFDIVLLVVNDLHLY